MTYNSRYGGRMAYEDRTIPCWKCGTWFLLTIGEQKKADDAGHRWPNHCPPCRAPKPVEPKPEIERKLL